MATTVLVTNLPEVSKFYGDSIEIENFIREIQDYWAAQPNLDNDRKYSSILSKVSDSVRTELELNSKSINKDPVKALNHLQKIYHDPRPARRHLASFLNMAQRPDEEVREFANRLYKQFNTLKKKQAAEGLTEAGEAMLLDQFVATVAREPLRHRLAEMTHEDGGITFSQLRDAAIRWEQRSAGGERPAAAAAIAADALAPIQEVVRSLEQKFECLAASIQEKVAAPARPQPTPQFSPSQSHPMRFQPPPMHPYSYYPPPFQYHAPYMPAYAPPAPRMSAPPVANAQMAHQPQARPGRGNCHKCGERGHWAKDCPRNRRADRGPAQGEQGNANPRS